MSRPLHGGNLVWAATVAGCSPHALLDFSASINPLGPPATALAAARSHLAQLTAYPDPAYGDLRRAIAQHHDIAPDWVLVGNGAAELLTWASRELAALSATRLVVPAFRDYQRALAAFGGTLDPVKLPNLDTPQPPATPSSPFPAALFHTSVENVGYLLNNPHNPTGQLFAAASLAPALAASPLVVVDEAFMDFLPLDAQQSLVARVAACPNLVVIRSLTKFYSVPGLRLGYAIAHPDRLQRWQQWRDPWPVNTLAAAAGRAMLEDTAFQRQTWAWLPPARAHLQSGLAAAPALQPWPSAANFLLVRAAVAVPELQQALLQRHRILIRDCLSFPELGDRWFRVAVRTQVENQQLLDALAVELPRLATDS